MKNLAGQEVGIEVGMVCKQCDHTFRHIKFIDGEMVGYSFAETIGDVIKLPIGYVSEVCQFKYNVCVGYHNPVGEDGYGNVVHVGDSLGGYKVFCGVKSLNGDGKNYVVVCVENASGGWLWRGLWEYSLTAKNPLRCQQEKTPEQIEKEKWITEGQGKGWVRDGRVVA